jgi:hypothetical protein
MEKISRLEQVIMIFLFPFLAAIIFGVVLLGAFIGEYRGEWW